MSAGIGVTIAVDTTEVDKGLDGMNRRAHQLRPAFRALKKSMRADLRQHAARQQGPNGGWPARKTLGASGKKGHRHLPGKVLGKLPSATVVSSDAHGVFAVNPVKWAAVHQYGGRAGKRAQIPARPFLWISGHLLDTAGGVLTDHVLGGF